MGLFDGLAQAQALLDQLSPSGLQKLARQRLSDVVEAEIGRSRDRVLDLERRLPSALPRELSHHLTEEKKSLASLIGGITGAFGVVGIPADLLAMGYLQVSLVVDVATAHKVPLKGERAHNELLDVLGYASGLGPLHRSGPRLFGSVAGLVLQRTGMKGLGRALPVAAAPISAWLNQRHIQQVGEQAIRFYAGLEKAHHKGRRGNRRAADSGAN